MNLRTAIRLSTVFLLAAMSAARADPIRFITIDTAPWASTETTGGQPVGVFPDVVAEIARRTGLDIHTDLAPFARIPRELEANRQDCTILVWSDQWAPFMTQGEIVSTHVMGVIARKGMTLRSYEDLHGMSVSMLRGLSLGSRFDSDTSIQRQYDTDYNQGLNKLAHGRLDAVAGALPTIRHLARQSGLEDHLGDQIALSELVLRFQCAKGSPRLGIMPQVDAAIGAMVADGTIERIKTRWNYH
jgi:polar amino acid transport system substrate-binding protein